MPKGQYAHKSRPLAERFWSSVDKSGECWLWTGATIDGYGRIGVGHRGTQPAHRIAWTLTFGDPGDRAVTQACGKRACVRPEHLELGRHLPKGEDHALAKLTEAAVLDIRSSASSAQSLAARYGVTYQCVRDVLNRKTWAWLTAVEGKEATSEWPRVS